MAGYSIQILLHAHFKFQAYSNSGMHTESYFKLWRCHTSGDIVDRSVTETQCIAGENDPLLKKEWREIGKEWSPLCDTFSG